MLKKIEIKGFRSFSQESWEKINFNPKSGSNISLIVGANNAGKSNILKAISFALNPDESSIKREDFSIRRSQSKSKKSGITEKKAKEINIRLLFDDATLLPNKYKKQRTKREFNIELIATGSDANSFKKTYKLNGKHINSMKCNSGLDHLTINKELLEKISINTVPTIRNIEYLNIFKQMLPKTGRSGLVKILKQFGTQLKNKTKRNLSAFKNHCGVDSVGFEPKIDIDKIIDTIDFNFIIDEGYNIPIKNTGHGFVSKSIINASVKNTDSKLIGLEEIELHMHPNIIKALLDDIKNYKKQFIITTHSPIITNFIEPKNIIVVKKRNRYSKIYQLDTLINADYKEIENYIFIQQKKADFLFSEGVIFVEGPYDRILYGKIYDKFNIDIARVGFNIIEACGDSKFMPFIKLAKAISLKWVVIADKKAFYISPTEKGKFLKGLIKNNFITEQDANNIAPNGILDESVLSQINAKISMHMGKIFIIPGDDISGDIIDCFSNISEYKRKKQLYTDIGGNKHETNRKNVETYVVAKIKGKKEEMVIMLDKMTKSELTKFSNIMKDSYKWLLPTRTKIKKTRKKLKPQNKELIDAFRVTRN